MNAKTVWKFRLELQAWQTITMPAGAEVLTCQLQDGFLTLWAIVQPSATAEPVEIAICGTGNPVPSKYEKYISSVIAGNFVWHVFQL